MPLPAAGAAAAGGAKAIQIAVAGKQAADALKGARHTPQGGRGGSDDDSGDGPGGSDGGPGRGSGGSSGGKSGGGNKFGIALAMLVLVAVLAGSLVSSLVGSMAGVLGGALASVSGGAAAAATAACVTSNASVPTAEAVADIPQIAYDAYNNAAEVTGIDWAWIAAIGKVESDHGRYGGGELDPVSGVRSPPLYGIPIGADTDSGALDGDIKKDRAVGPMQFIPSTWRGGASKDGDFDGRKDPQNIFDSALAAGFYLKQRGAPGNMDKAILGYNNSQAYLADVKSWYTKYQRAAINSGQGKVTKTQGEAPASQLGTDAVRLAHANIKVSLPAAGYQADLNKMVSYAPDFITLNEVHSRSDRAITPPGYTSFRGINEPEAKEVAVAWRHDRWDLITKGSILTADTNLRWARRYLSWAMLRDDQGRVVSVVSTHALTNPYSGARRKIAGRYVEAMNRLVNILGEYGGVIVGGDVNVHYPRDVRDQYPFTPYLGFKGSQLFSTYQLLGNHLVTGDRGATLNWIFTQKPGPLTVRRHAAYDLNSDHRLVIADFDLPKSGTRAARAMSAGGLTTGSADQVEALAAQVGDTAPDSAADSIETTQAGGSGTGALPDGMTVSEALEGGLSVEQIIALGSETTKDAQRAAAREVAAQVVAGAQGKKKPNRGDSDWKMPMRPGTFVYTATWGQAGSSWSSGYHTGLDFAAPSGTPVYAAYGGTIIRRTDQGWAGPFFTMIDHGTIDGKSVFTWYAHMSESFHPTGTQVATGERIGSVGSLGNSSGDHLHFEVRVNGVDVDPRIWLAHAGAPDVSGEPGGGCGPTGSSGVVGADGAWGGYENGKIPLSAMCKLSFYDTYLECNAAKSLELLNNAFTAEFGRSIGPVGGYRSYEAQVQCVKEKGSLCATPGTSNHGWGLAVDLDGGGINIFGTPQHKWMRANAEKFGWLLPPWAREDGSKPEAWHWQYGLTD